MKNKTKQKKTPKAKNVFIKKTHLLPIIVPQSREE